MAEQSQSQPSESMSKEEQIGFHKGAISVLSKENEELSRIVSITEQLVQMHVRALADLGVDVSSVQEQTNKDGKSDDGSGSKKRVPIENLI